MWTNVGQKLMMLAKLVCWLGIAVSIIGGIVLMTKLEGVGVVLGILVILLGSLAAWLGSLATYAIGEICAAAEIRSLK